MSAGLTPPPMQLWLEQAILDELPPERAQRLREQLGDAEFAARCEALRRSDTDLRELLDAKRVVPEIEHRIRRARAATARKRAPRHLMWAAPALGAAMAALLWYPTAGPPRRADEEPLPAVESVRLKGLAPHLVLYRKKGEEAERLVADATVEPGDVLQMGYVSAGRKFGLILSIDGAGAVTVHAPKRPEPVLLEPEGETLLPFAYELDDAPDFERFILVAAHEPFEVATVLRSARRLAASRQRATGELSLPDGLEQASVILWKGAEP